MSWRPLPGGPETIAWLQDRQIEFRLVTNTSSKSRREIANLLADAGMRVEAAHILTAVTSAARYLRQSHPGAGCLVVNEGDLREDLVGIEIAEADSAGVVLLGGAGPSLGYAELDAAFKLAVGGTPVVALHRNTHYRTREGPALHMGAFILGLEAAAAIQIPIVGKPVPAFLQAALASLGADAGRTVMIGDDIDSDVLGAQGVGMTGVLVEDRQVSTRRPRPVDGPAGSGDRGHRPPP